jgi:hypothetical protein
MRRSDLIAMLGGAALMRPCELRAHEAKALGLTVPPTLIVRAHDVFE